MFTFARLDYDRIDYGVVGGRPQAYEINTNPTIISAETETPNPSSEWFVGVFAEHLTRLEASTPNGREPRWIRIEHPLEGSALESQATCSSVSSASAAAADLRRHVRALGLR